jgi:hypothetical protein
MKKLTILIPKIKPPEEPDIITNQLKNIFSELKEQCEIKLVWMIFQPEKFDEYEYENSVVLDYHQFNNAIESIEKIKPDLIITEVRLGINGIIFTKSGNHCKIPVVTITPTGESEFFSQNYSAKSNFQLFMSDKVLADSSKDKNPKKFGMFRYSLHRYFFLINTLKKINYSLFDLIKFFMLYPRIQIFSKSYPALHKITSGNLNICFNKHWESRLLDVNFPKSSIFLCGDPAFDKLHQRIQQQKNSKIIDSKKINILFCPTPMHEHGWMKKKEEDELIVKLIQKILELEDISISLKIHPSSSSYEEYDNLLKSHNLDIPLFQKENTIDLLQKSDLMITYGSSNVILDAILLKKPIILFKNSMIPDLSRLSDKAVIVECSKIDDLDNLISKIVINSISDESFENYIKKQIGNFDGKNSQRISNMILKLTQKNSL